MGGFGIEDVPSPPWSYLCKVQKNKTLDGDLRAKILHSDTLGAKCFWHCEVAQYDWFKLVHPWAERPYPVSRGDVRDGGRVGLENQGGVIRADLPGVRVWGWVGDRGGADVGRASAHGAGPES